MWRRHERDVWIVLLMMAGLLVLLAEARALGPVGRPIAKILAVLFGVSRFALPVILLGLGVAFLWGKIEVERARLGWGVALGLLSICGLGDLAGGRPTLHAGAKALGHAGGWLGVVVGGGLNRGLGVAGSLVVLFALLVVAIIVTTGVGLRALVAATAAVVRFVAQRLSLWWGARPTAVNREGDQTSDVTPIPRSAGVTRVNVEPPTTEPDGYADDFVEEPEPQYEPSVTDEAVPARAPRATSPGVAAMASEWVMPPLALLLRTKEQKQDRTAIALAGDELVEALAAHGVETTLIGYTVGPTVTRFELELGPGVKVSRVTSLNKDIAYAMATPDVRILAPIPGRSAIGVEVPNRQRTLVALGDLLATEEALAARHPLDVPIGRDISGKTVVVNLGEMPHVLISGATGAGKSSGLNSLITSLVMRATPDQLRLILVDPKRVEMGQYNDLPHLLAPVVVDAKKAAGALAWAVKEMERRYDILAESGARDITSYQLMIARGELTPQQSLNEQVADAIERATGLESDVESAPGPEKLPYIIIVVDELNDLMMVAARDVEESVVRIAQMARGASRK